MAESKNMTTPQQGMVQDLAPMHLKETQYPWALNAAVETNSGEGNLMTLQNDGSNVLATRLPDGYQVVGRLHVPEQNRTLFFLSGASSMIGEVIDCTYDDDSRDSEAFSACDTCTFERLVERTPLEAQQQEPYCPFRVLVQDDCLNFSIDHPVRARYRITDCGLNIYYTDELNQRRFTYFDYSGDNPRGPLVLQERFKKVIGYGSEADCSLPIYADELDCNKTLYHPSFEVPYIRAVEVVPGGECKAGMVQAFICYADRHGNPLTEYFPSTNPAPIFTRTVTFETNYKTDKAVKITVEGLDQSFLYTHYNIVIAETVDNFTEMKLLGTYPTTQSTTLYTGNEENLRRVTPDEVFFRKAYYKTASNLATANGHLFFSDLAEFSKPNLQRAALGVRLYWQTVALPESAYRDPKNTQRFRSYMRDEVYALGLEYVTQEGEVLGTYHVPGPSKEYFKQAYNTNVDDPVSNADVMPADACGGSLRNRRWQVYNTAVKIGAPHQLQAECGDTTSVWEWGDFAYWESSERYPNNPTLWGELCGQPIRHHRFPDSSVTHIHDSLDGTKSYQDSNMIFPIGVRVDHQSVVDSLDRCVAEGIISLQDRARIAGYRLVRGNRVGQKSVVAKGLLYDMWSYDKHGHKYYYPNYPYNDLRNDNFISNDPDTYKGGNNSDPIPNVFSASGRYTFHSPDVHFVNAAIGTELKLETLEYGQSEGYFNLCEDQAKQKFLSTAAVTLSFAAGVAAALSATEEKECVTYTVKSNITQDNTTVSSNTSGTTSTRSYAGSSFAAGTGTIVAIPATDSWNGNGDATINHGDVKPSNLNFTPFSKKTGQQTEPPEQVETTTKTTCKGTPYQLLSPLSGSEVGLFLQQAVYKGILGIREMQIMMELIEALVPLKNLSAQYNSVGRYTNFKAVPNSGNKVRAIERSAYLEPRVQLINEAINATASQFTNIYVNNWGRERSVYLKIDPSKKFPAPSVEDNSRNTMDQLGLEQSDLGKRVYRTISSYYAAVKNLVPDQYGKLTDVQYLPTGSRTFKLARAYSLGETAVFSGDTFINRFALKRKMPFFLQTRFAMNNGSDALYSELGNVGYPNYYFNTPEPLLERIGGNTFGGNVFSIAADLLGVANTRLDAKKQKVFYQSGLIHLYSYGIPYFFVESDINVDMRHAVDNGAKDFYPHQQDLDYWLQEKNVSPKEDNYYLYNTTYSKQNREAFVAPQVRDLPKDCKVTHPSTVIQSEQDFRDSTTDRWLIFKANNRFDFPSQKGRVVGLDGLDNEKVLVRFENSFQVFGAYATLATSEGEVVVGNGGVFQSRPQEGPSVPLGFGGSQHTDLLSSEHGHVWADAKRGQVFIMQPGGGMDELAKDGMKNWFKENLPFQMLRDFPTLSLKDCDNHFKGLGLHLAFDKRFSRLLLTKLDYKPNYKTITYDEKVKTFSYNGQSVALSDPQYFTPRGWTISYNFLTKSWVSFHSFIPNFYVDSVDYFQSGLNGATPTLWSHGVTNKSFQVYYGKRYPFSVETVSGLVLPQGVLQSVSFVTDAIRYQNSYDAVYNPEVTFNRAWVYNEGQFSGPLVLHVRDQENLAQSISYPKVEDAERHILVTNDRGVWNFNQFHDTVASPESGVPFLPYAPNRADKRVHYGALNFYKPDLLQDKIRGRQTRVRLTQDQHSNYKLIYHLIQPEHLNG